MSRNNNPLGTHTLEVIGLSCVHATFWGNGYVDFTDATVAIGDSGLGMTEAGATATRELLITGKPINPGSTGLTTPGPGNFTTLNAVSLTTTGTIVTGAITTTGIVSGVGSGLTSLPAGNLTGSINGISIGGTTASDGRFMTLTATGATALSPANANVTISPSGTGSVTVSPAGTLTINPNTTGTINRVNIGGTTPGTGAFTTLAAATSLTLGTSGILVGGMNLVEQRNGTSAQTLRIYDTYANNGSDFRRANLYWNYGSGDFFIETSAGGSGLSGLNHLNLKTSPGKQIRFFGGSGSGNIWNFDGSGHFVPGYDNGYDIGSQLYRVRDLNLARDVIVGGKVK